MHAKAAALLDAHVAWMADRLQGDALRDEVERQVDAFLADGKRLKLKDVVKPAAIQQTARKYAVEMELGGAMPELVGHIARSLYGHRVLDRTRLADLMPDKLFEELLDKLLELKPLRTALVHEAVGNPIFASLIADLLTNGIRDYVASGTQAASRVPGAASALKLGKAVVARAKPSLGDTLEGNLRAFARKHTEASLKSTERFLLEAIESDQAREVILDLWADKKHLPVSTLRKGLSQLDVEELFVIIYERWQHLRKTALFGQLVDAGIDTFFETFGDYTLAALLDEIGVTREMMIDDALRFAPQVVSTLKKKKMLEPAIRRQLEGFYASPAAQDILKG